METVRYHARKIRIQLAKNPIMTLRAVVTALVILLVTVICIFTANQSYIHSEYAQVKRELSDSVYAALYEMYYAYKGADQPGANLEDVILPKMKEHYAAAQTLDNAMVNCYGSEYRVITATVSSAFENAFSAFDSAYRMGKSTTGAATSMQDCMYSLESLLVTRFDADHNIIPSK